MIVQRFIMITNITTEKKYPLGHYFAILSKAYVGALFKGLEASVVDRYYMVVQVLNQPKQQFTQQTLGNFLNVDKVTMVRIIDHLTEKGIIERVSNPLDRREKFIVLTAQGKKAMKEINEITTSINNIAMDGFSDTEKDQFYDMLQRMHVNLADLPKKTIYLNFKRSKK